MNALASIFLAVAAAVPPTNSLDVARQALRDGFWSLARTHAGAQAATRDEARLIVLEAWAREGRWTEIPKALASWGDPRGDAYVYYRALALAKTGEGLAARDVFRDGLPKDPVYARLGARLLAEVALARGEWLLAVEALGSVSRPEADDRLLLAEARSRLNEPKKAAALWREVLADTNASARASVTAAANLGDKTVLRKAVSNDVPAEVRTLARLRLGCLLLADDGTFGEGAELVRKTATESPDADGARESFQTLAAARLRRGDWSGAAKAYRELLEIWPAAARRADVQEGLGRALLRQGQSEDALLAFRRAEECATTDEDRASAAAETADALAALGRTDESTAKYREILKAWPKVSIAPRLEKAVRLREREAEGRALYARYRFADAQKAFREVGAGDATRRGRMAFFEVLCLYGQGRDAEAEAQARKLARETDEPRLKADVTRWLARAAYNGGRWREAQGLFDAYAKSPGVPANEAADARVWAARAAVAANDFATAIQLAAKVVAAPPSPPVLAEAQIVQGEALLELARFDEAVLVLERAAKTAEAPARARLEAQILRADALYALGADNPARYEQALADYRAIGQSEQVPEESRLTLAYKIGATLEKLGRRDEAVDQYYAHVVLAYRDARQAGRRLDDAARGVFARAAFRLADLCEANGSFLQALKTLELVAASDVPAASEARQRIARLRTKGVLP